MTSNPTPFLRRQQQRAAPVGGALLLALATMAPDVKASSLLVDGFDAPTAPVTSVFTSVDMDVLTEFSPSVLGGVRTIVHSINANPLGSVAALAVGNGVLSSSSGVGTQTQVLMLYGAFNFNTGALLGLDTTPYNTLRLSFSGYTSALNVDVTLYNNRSPSNDFPQYKYLSTAGSTHAPVVPGGPLVVDVAFDPSERDFEYGRVDGIAVIIHRADGGTGMAWTLDSFSLVSAVPEPTPAALLLAGVAVLGWLRRRQATLDAQA